MRILIAGGKGMLARDLVAVLAAQEHEVSAPGHAELDISDRAQVQRAAGFRPDVVINCAAFTKVDDCEHDPDRAFRINALGTQNLALLCQALDAPLLQISTDYVFAGDNPDGYYEFDRTGPLSVYGKSKLAGELYVQWLLRKFYIVRTSWLFGQGGPNFVKTILKLAAERPELKVVDDQQGSPTWTADLARAIARLLATGQYGVYHLTNSGATTWYDFARRALELCGNTTSIHPCTTAEFPRPAPRPACSILHNRNWQLLTGEPLPPWEEALANYLTIT